MNNFDTLYKVVQKIERGYTANDQGAPAYNGINKKWHPQWPGWKKIDEKKEAGLLKQGAFFPELEPLVKGFYFEFWKPVRVNEINTIGVSQLLVDMKTQHGRWAAIITAAFNNTDPLDSKTANTFNTALVKWINTDTATAYQAIAAKRLEYVKGIKLTNEGDRKGIIARAQLYVNAAAAFLKNNPGTATGAGLIGLAFFF
jgi:hypothetical protein